MLTFSHSKESQYFWTKKDIPLDILRQLKCDTYLKADFIKKGKHFSRPISRTYYLLQNYLLYGDINKMETLAKCKGYVHLSLIYVEFAIETKYYIIKLIQPGGEIQLYTTNQADYLQWKEALSNICIMSQFLKDFEYGHFLGKGNFSAVHMWKSRSDGKQYAVKMIQKSSLKQARKKEQIVNEIIALRQLEHPSILKAYRVYDSQQFLYLVTELLTGGTLVQKTKQTLSIQVLKSQLKSLLEALAHIHDNKIIHRDIKPDNIVFSNLSNPAEVKIIDFGLAALTKYNRYSYPQCGSPGFTAPELLSYIEGKKMYTGKCDVYSLGVTFFNLLYGYNPFKCDDPYLTTRKNSEGYIDFPKNTLVPDQVQRLLENMLKKYPKERYNAEEALQDPFFKEKFQRQINFTMPKVIITRKQNIIEISQFEEAQMLQSQSKLLNQSFSIQGSLNASHPMIMNLFNEIRNSRSVDCLVQSHNKCLLYSHSQRHFQEEPKQIGDGQIMRQFNQEGQRPKSNTTGQIYYEFVQIKSWDHIKESVLIEGFQLEAKHNSKQFQGQKQANQFSQLQNSQKIFRKVKVYKEDSQRIEPVNEMSSSLSTVHSLDHVHHPKRFIFQVQVTPFQKYKKE